MTDVNVVLQTPDCLKSGYYPLKKAITFPNEDSVIHLLNNTQTFRDSCPFVSAEIRANKFGLGKNLTDK